MNLFLPVFLFFFVFPYVGLWPIIGVGTQPLFIICALIYLALHRMPIVIYIVLISLFFWFVEQLFSVAFHGAAKIVRLDLILIMIASFFYPNIVQNIIAATRGRILIKNSVFFMWSLFFLMLILFYILPDVASDLNYAFSGHPQFFGGLGVSYYSPEPGLSAFGVVSLYIVYAHVFGKSSISFELFIFIIIILLLLGTLSLTGLCLIIISAFIFYGRTNSKKSLFFLFTMCIALLFIIGAFEIFDHAMARITALLNISENQDASPAIRINNLISLFADFSSLYENRVEHGSHPVGFVSYFTLLPFTAMSFLIFHLSRLQTVGRLVFIFSCVMLPLTSPFVFSIYLLQIFLNVGASINRSGGLAFNAR